MHWVDLSEIHTECDKINSKGAAKKHNFLVYDYSKIKTGGSGEVGKRVATVRLSWYLRCQTVFFPTKTQS